MVYQRPSVVLPPDPVAQGGATAVVRQGGYQRPSVVLPPDEVPVVEPELVDESESDGAVDVTPGGEGGVEETPEGPEDEVTQTIDTTSTAVTIVAKSPEATQALQELRRALNVKDVANLYAVVTDMFFLEYLAGKGVPFLGDIASSAFSNWFLKKYLGNKVDLPEELMVKIKNHQLIDAILGFIPGIDIVGDLYPANTLSADAFQRRYEQLLAEIMANSEELGIDPKDIRKATRRNAVRELVHCAVVDRYVAFVNRVLGFMNKVDTDMLGDIKDGLGMGKKKKLDAPDK